MEATKIKGAVIGKIFKADEKAEFIEVNNYLQRSNVEYEIRFFFKDREFAGGLILTEKQPRDEIKIPCFLRISRYELRELPFPLRRLIKSNDNVINCTITRTPVGTTYEARFNRDGYNIAVTATTLSELKSKFIEAAIAVEKI